MKIFKQIILSSSILVIVFTCGFFTTHCGPPQTESVGVAKKSTAVTSAPQQPQQPTTPTSAVIPFSKCTKTVMNTLSGVSTTQPEVSCTTTTNQPCDLKVQFNAFSSSGALEYQVDVPAGNDSNNPAHRAPHSLITGLVNLLQLNSVGPVPVGYFPFFARVSIYRSLNPDGSLPNEREEYTCTP